MWGESFWCIMGRKHRSYITVEEVEWMRRAEQVYRFLRDSKAQCGVILSCELIVLSSLIGADSFCAPTESRVSSRTSIVRPDAYYVQHYIVISTYSSAPSDCHF